ncbi:MAG: GWxTD domain-containing protein [Bacteroidetes bacterium]|jgi:GWxTD domain-containing protein|nr:GWxTD domain-containing protein [Bacteroidota bacterium]
MRTCSLLLAGVVFALLVPLPTTAQPADTLWAQATSALAAGRTTDGIALLERLTAQQPDDAEAHYRLARAHAEASPPDYRAAKQALARALDLDADNPRYLTLRLHLRREAPPALFPNYQEWKRKRLAERLLDLDPDNALAHVELGEWAAATYFQFRDAVTVSGDVRPPDDPYAAFQTYDEVAQKRRVLGVTTLDKRETAAPAFAEAVDHLEQALRADPSERALYAPLLRLYLADSSYAEAARVATAMQAAFPDDATPHLYAGMAHVFGGDVAAADAAFARALPLLSAADRRSFDDLAVLFQERADDRVPFAQDAAWTAPADRFWTVEDPRLLTDVSERRLEHYARLAYADLFFGADDRRGWETEIGQVLVRYGLPRRVEDQSVGGVEDATLLRTWYYDGFHFRFDKTFRADSYRFTDYIQTGAQHVYAQEPQRTQYTPPGRRRPVDALASAFKGEDGQTDLYVPMAVPVPPAPQRDTLALPMRTGAFLLQPEAGLVARQQRTTDALDPSQLRARADTTYWQTAHRLTAAPGDYTLAVEFEADGARAVGYERAAVTLPDFTGDGLRLSDLVPAISVEEVGDSEDAAAGELLRNGYAIRALPWDALPAGQPLYLYVEAYGLTPGADYEVEAALTPQQTQRGWLRRLFGGSEAEGVSVRFTTTATATDEGQYVILDTADLAPGTVEIRLQVRDTQTGDRVSSTRTLRLD